MENNVNEISDLALVALAGIKSKSFYDNAKKEIKKGKYHVEGLYRLNADVFKGADEEKPCMVSVPYKDMLIALLSKMNTATRQKFIKDFADDKIVISNYEEKKEEIDNFWKSLGKKFMKSYSGKTRIKGSLEKVPEA